MGYRLGIYQDKEMIQKMTEQSFLSSLNAVSPLNIPTYDGSGEAVHPSILYFTNRWNGYRYWMAFTPYTKSQEEYENPSIVVSNDGIHWVQPEGLVNPVVEKPEDGHLSDPNLCLSFNNRLFMFYRKRYRIGNGMDYDEIFTMYSKDGVHWSSPESILAGDKEKGAALLLSPAVIIHSSQYYLYTVSYRNRSIQLRVSDSLIGPWSNPVDITLSRNLPDNIVPWHINAVRYRDYFEFIIVMQDKNRIEADSLYYGWSSDGKSILLYDKPILHPSKNGWDDGKIYQGSLVPIIKYGRFRGYYLYYSARGKNKVWNIGRTMAGLIGSSITSKESIIKE